MHFPRWSQGNVGRYGEFTIQESENKDIARASIALITRAIREKKYTQALGFLQAIPHGMMLGKGSEYDAIRMMTFDAIADNFDNTPTAAAIHMQLLLKSCQIDQMSVYSVMNLAGLARKLREPYYSLKS
jgi:hypothetical protein